MNLYTYSLLAIKNTANGFTAHHAVFAILRENKDEALGVGYRTCKETYPVEEGYYSHQVTVLLIPLEFSAEVVAHHKADPEQTAIPSDFVDSSLNPQPVKGESSVSENNYTPGPWEKVSWPNGYCRILGSRKVIAMVDPMRNEPEGLANANLIAAVPELLEALEELLRVLGEAEIPFDAILDEPEIPLDAIIAARAAIAKARGCPRDCSHVDNE